MRRALLGAVLMLSLGMATPAYADHDDGDRYSQREGCGEQGGGCNNEREEDYSGAGCKYVCPSFDKSPVHDAFNFSPFVCMPGATCYEDGDKRKGGGQGEDPQPGETPRAAMPNPACLLSVPWHCDEKPH